MTNPNLPPLDQDNWLADFADQVLEGRPADPSVAGADLEMQVLANVVLRLNHAFPPKDLDIATVKRMQRETMARWRKEEQGRKNSWVDIFRLDWLAPSRRGQMGWALTMIAIAGILILSLPVLSLDPGSIAGTAGMQLRGVFLWIIPLAVILVMTWLLRRK
ncbi:MAG: hypothetical protein Q7J80_04750 [Anaerolineales bacterium]|nr:hypothetical protein [Anaerolineales bacterium]